MATSLRNGGFPLSATALIDSLNPKRPTSSDPTLLTSSQLDLLQQGEQEIDEVLEEEENEACSISIRDHSQRLGS